VVPETGRGIGPACHRLIERVFAHRVLDNLRAAQGGVRLAKRFGPQRLEGACHRALAFDDPKYRTVKTILEKGQDQLAGEERLFDALAESYTGQGRFCRDTGKLLSHCLRLPCLLLPTQGDDHHESHA